MEESIRLQLQDQIKDCSKNKMPYVCRRIQSQEGLDFVTNKVISIIKDNPDFTLENAIGHVEMELNETDLY